MITRVDFEKFCDGKTFKLSEYADKIINRINACDGNCPCRIERVICPCPTHEKEITEIGHCHCNLFIKR